MKKLYKYIISEIRWFWYRVGRAVRYAKIVYNSEYGPSNTNMLRMEKMVLEELQDEERVEWYKKREKICIKLIDIITGDDPSTEIRYKDRKNKDDVFGYDILLTHYVNTRNAYRFDVLGFRDDISIDAENTDSDTKNLLYGELRKAKAIYLYNSIRNELLNIY